MNTLKKTLHISLGILLLCIGIAGLVLPILNGTIFLLLGLILLSFESTFVERRLQKYASKNKHIEHWYAKLDAWMRKIFRGSIRVK